MAEFNKKQTFLRLNFFEGESVAESPFIEVDSLPENGDVGEIYRLTSTGELYCFLAASQFGVSEALTIAINEQQASAFINELIGYDTCHKLFTAVHDSGEEFSCIIYTSSEYDQGSGYISSMQGSDDYGTGYDRYIGGAYSLANGSITFSRLMESCELSNFGYGNVTITSITPLGEKFFDFSTGGKVNITEGKVIK